MSVEKSDLKFYQLTQQYLVNTSELNLFNILKDTTTREYFLNIFRTYVINAQAQSSVLFYLTHEVDNAEFPDTISMKYYGTPHLWWVIGLFNDIKNPFEEFDTGSNLRILKPSYLYQLLQEIQLVGSQ